MSPSSRRAWIEINFAAMLNAAEVVALLAEGVDRNVILQPDKPGDLGSPSSRRAWIEIRRKKKTKHVQRSPSSRRAWIEIRLTSDAEASHSVALLAEGVDRNTEREDKVAARHLSPSSRRAWIEIFYAR